MVNNRRKNDKRHNSQRRSLETNPLSNTENIQFNIKSPKQQDKQKQSSSSKLKKKWKKKQNTENQQEHSKSKQNSHNIQERWKGKTTEHNEIFENDNSKKLSIKKYSFGIERLTELCCKDPTEIVFVLSNNLHEIVELFKQKQEPDWIFLLMKVSGKICSSESTQGKTFLLTEITCNQFLDQLKTYILSTPTEKDINRCNSMNIFYEDCLVVFQSMITLFPKTAKEKLKEIIVSSNIALNGIKSYSNHIKINETTIVKMNELLEKLKDTVLTEELKLKEKLVIENIAQLMAPPEDFRELTVYPTAIDLEYGEPFLRPNISKGAYQNVEHYLDVQFRLLREDFIGPLREGIQFYKDSINDERHHQRRKKINNIRIYRDIEFEKKGEFVRDKYGYLVNFDKKNKLKIDWELKKGFMCGSLLLFSGNNFKNFFLGIVLERKIELLKQGKLIVQLLEASKPVFNTSLTMIESEVYFEPYKCSMEVLKTITSHNFPMEKYIISACIKIDYPYYIDELPEHTYYEINKLPKFQVLSQNDWPTKEQLGLDEMQYGAFRAALTQAFTVIQGPPGTGKTFIGLKIMNTIINNLYKKSALTKPILVVCYTNHALDQFMEGILSFTKKVVRIGGQSKSEKLKQYSLRNISRTYRKSITINTDLRNELVKTTMENIKYFKKCSEIVSYNTGILELSLLKNGMPKQYHKFFKTNLDLITWLFKDFDYFKVDSIVFLNTIFNELFNRDYHSEKLLEIKKEDNNESMRYELDKLELKHNHKDIDIYSITLDDINKACKELLQEIIRLENQSDKSVHFFNESEEVKFNLTMMEKIQSYFVCKMNSIDDDIVLPRTINKLNALNMRQRWSLYFRWLKETKDLFDKKIINCEQKYTQAYKKYAELREMANIELLNKMHVVALTTTGAAKHRIMLEGLESPIVVVEEAAEVLEAHIVSSLTSHCQHLILIGDHKQLRPSNAVYKLAKDFNFDISLFERMVNNDVPCYTLSEQHRMRPEISSLIAPSIYTELKNHISVQNREHIRGVTKDIFFLNHNMQENEVEESSSKSNEHEANFLIMFARHLILQGYKPDQITILTTYSGQLFLICSLKKKHSILEKIKITVVDNYQGEESDIILLSLVRSNEKGNVGFLKTENRICVALSRAKYGLYIMGNMDNLYNSGNLWKQIKETLINQGSYGDELTLECAIHSGITTKVAKSEDFNIIEEGGCSMFCKSLLLCGHYCTRKCHSHDCEHLKFKCMEPCDKSCINNHPCKKRCFMNCGKCDVPLIKELPCGHQMMLSCSVDVFTFPCEEMVETVLEKCGHRIFKKCHDKKPICTYKCIDRLDCGHACEKNCHKDDDPDHEKYKCLKPCENIHKKCSLNHKCQKMCYEDCSLYCDFKVHKNLPCGHIKKDSPCGLEIDDIKCILPCDRPSKCDHKCQYKCYEKCRPCENQVLKVIPDCGHSITMKCKTKPERKLCTKKCERILECGHLCKKFCANECIDTDCKEIVLQKTSKLACGHNKMWVFCCDKFKEFKLDSQYLLEKCREPCLQQLKCNDICLGTCGECKQGRLHIPCSMICKKINPCNHTCKFLCKEQCPPCNQKCIYSCLHSKCSSLCGNACVPCQEKCEWNCPHFKCTRKCFELCNRKPCYKPCTLKLKCGHECIGFCGEPCPPLCRICQENEITSIVFGNKDVQNARFVYLEDCEHIIESDTLTDWMNLNDEEICLKQCPLCKTPILKTQRFMNQVKVILDDLSKIKIKQYGDVAVIRGKMKTIIDSLKFLDDNFFSNYFGDDTCIKYSWDKFCKPLLRFSNYKSSMFSLPPNDIESLNFVIDLFKTISKYKHRINTISDPKNKQTIINHFDWILFVAFTYAPQLSNQQKFDINMEMARGTRIMNLYNILYNSKFQKALDADSSNAIQLKDLVCKMEAELMSYKIYTVDIDTKIKKITNLIHKKIKIAVITVEEKQRIEAAMSTSFSGSIKAQGHWRKCRYGHLYCVMECRVPIKQSVCPECKV